MWCQDRRLGTLTVLKSSNNIVCFKKAIIKYVTITIFLRNGIYIYILIIYYYYYFKQYILRDLGP